MNNDTTKYFRNNIEFRAASSKALGHFKNCQAFMLNELVSGNHSFSPISRDIALLYYDTWFKAALSMEHTLLRNDIHTNKSELVGLRNNIYREASIIISQIFSKHSDIFLPEYVRLFFTVTHPYLDISNMIAMNTLIKGVDKSSIFTSLIDIDVEYLSSIMYIIHELDCLYEIINNKSNEDCTTETTDELFICVNYFALHHFKDTRKNTEIDRLSSYIEKLGSIKVRKLTIKAYIPVTLIGLGIDEFSPSGAYVLKLADKIKQEFNIDDICFE